MGTFESLSAFSEEREKYDFLFSVVIPVYNTEEYLEETIESVVNQTIGFEDNIQLILVNNATEDNSEEICLKYKEKYPHNVVYEKLEVNQGPCKARNIGMAHATGWYINFMDSDDKWDLDSFEAVRSFLSDGVSTPSVICCRERCFDAWSKWHIYDYIYQSDKMCSIHEDYQATIFAAHAAFIRAEIIEDISFDETLTSCEDMLFMTEILLDVEEFAVMRSAVYYYRQRSLGGSQVQNMTKRREWFFSDYNTVIDRIVCLCVKKFGYVIPYVQYLFMSNMQGRARTKFPVDFTNEEKNIYLQKIQDVLKLVDEDIISRQKLLSREQKNLLIQMKDKINNIYQESYYRKGVLFYKNLQIYSLLEKQRLNIDIIQIKNGQLTIRGICNLALPNNSYKIVFVHQNDEIPLSYEQLDSGRLVYCFGDVVFQRKAFKVVVPLYKDTESYFLLYYGLHKIHLKFELGKYAKLSPMLENAYYHKENYILNVRDDEKIIIQGAIKKEIKRHEHMLLGELMRKRQWKALVCRLLSKVVSMAYKKKQIWLITDRILSADDCGEYFFRYLSTCDNKNICAFFIISKESPDWKRLKKFGKVVQYRSWKHRILFLCASKIISSLTNDWVLDAIPYSSPYLRDMLDFEFVHLQHGVIKDDLSTSINCFKKNISLFITSGYAEQRSILNLPYGYDDSNVKVLGLPRFDCLKYCADTSDSSKVLLIAPTWRSNLVGKKDMAHDCYFYNPLFKNSEFYQFYNALIHDKRLCEALRKYGVKGELRLHPMLQVQNDDFTSNDVFSIQSKRESYGEDMQKTALVVTDYSSAAFDYAYFNKPVIYTQFDKDEFYAHHTYQEGYFDYETMGFGPVCYDYESTVQAIIQAIENNCVMEDKYQKRVDEFFAYRDNHNCERIYQEILKLDGEE